MGERLSELYAKADSLGGFPAKVRLAGLVGITSTQASSVADTPELIERCEQALKGMGLTKSAPGTGNLPRPASPPPTGSSGRIPASTDTLRPGSGPAAETRLRRFNSMYKTHAITITATAMNDTLSGR